VGLIHVFFVELLKVYEIDFFSLYVKKPPWIYKK